MNEQQVQTLMEALPYLSNFKDKTIVVKAQAASLVEMPIACALL